MEPPDRREPPDAEPRAPGVLSYQSPVPDEPRRPGPVGAALLALPGSLCWLLLAGAVFYRFVPAEARRAVSRIGRPEGLPLLWAAAVVTAVASVAYYSNKPKPWYVALCLGINGLGLLFTLGMACLVSCVFFSWSR